MEQLAAQKPTLHATNVERKAILQEIAVSKGRVDREENINKRAISFCFKDLQKMRKFMGSFNEDMIIFIDTRKQKMNCKERVIMTTDKSRLRVT